MRKPLELDQIIQICFIIFGYIFIAAVSTLAQNAVTAGEIETELPTLHFLGYRWFISGDDNGNAMVAVSYREVGEGTWLEAMPLRRVEVAAMEDRRPPEGQGLFAGSIGFLRADTEYEVRLVLSDPDGGRSIETIRQRTWKEPVAPRPMRLVHVIPGSGGGIGTETDPFRGLNTAADAVRPGDFILVHAGVYRDTISITRSGTPEAPIVWRGAGDGDAIIEGTQGGPRNDARDIIITMYGVRYVFFEKLIFSNSHWAFHASNSSHITIRRCQFKDVAYGYFADAQQERVFLCDNLIEGTESWVKTRDGNRFENRGIDISGIGHVICYNRIRNFGDGVDIRPAYPIRAIDIHNNDISECTDDAIELDFSEHNIRAYTNRITNVGMGISFQPCRGGPAYVIRNVLYNVGHETWKLHLTPVNPKPDWATGPHRTSGGVIVHNTIVKSKPPFRVWSQEGPANNFFMRNNLYVGTGVNAIEVTCPLNQFDSDYNAYAIGNEQPWRIFARIYGKSYHTIEELASRIGQEQHGMSLTGTDEIFHTSVSIPERETLYTPPDLQLSAESPVLDKGAILPNLSGRYSGEAPDLGAYELGDPPPHYGIRPEGQEAEIDARMGIY